MSWWWDHRAGRAQLPELAGGGNGCWTPGIKRSTDEEEADGGISIVFPGLCARRSKSPAVGTDARKDAPALHRVVGTQQRSPGSGTAHKAMNPTLLLLLDTLGTHGREMSPWIYPPFPISLISPLPLPPPCWNQSLSWHFKGQCAGFMAVPYKTIPHDNTSSPLLGTFGKFISQTFFCADRWGPAITSLSTRVPPTLSQAVQPLDASSPQTTSGHHQPPSLSYTSPAVRWGAAAGLSPSSRH